jgi:hypothetical protein
MMEGLDGLPRAYPQGLLENAATNFRSSQDITHQLFPTARFEYLEPMAAIN